VVQQMLGHASAAMTLDQDGHLFGDGLDEVADRMAAARRVAVARGGSRGSWGDQPERYNLADIGLRRRCPRQDSNLRSRLRRALFAMLKIVGKWVSTPNLLAYMCLSSLIDIGPFQF
jgi:hypothetical protein